MGLVAHFHCYPLAASAPSAPGVGLLAFRLCWHSQGHGQPGTLAMFLPNWRPTGTNHEVIQVGSSPHWCTWYQGGTSPPNSFKLACTAKRLCQPGVQPVHSCVTATTAAETSLHESDRMFIQTCSLSCIPDSSRLHHRKFSCRRTVRCPPAFPKSCQHQHARP